MKSPAITFGAETSIISMPEVSLYAAKRAKAVSASKRKCT